MKPHITSSFVALLAALLFAAPASAQVRLVAHTDVPVFHGFGVDAELPGRLRFATSLGRLPAGYVGLANALLVPVFKGDGYDSSVAELVQHTIKRSNVWRTTLGWRPLKRSGFVFGLGYTLAGMGGDATEADILSGASGVPAPSVGGRAPEFAMSATVQMLHAEVGWTWDLPWSLWLRTGIGMGATIKANTSVEAQFDADHPAVEPGLRKFETTLQNYLHDTLTSYVHPPHVSLAIGWWI